MANNPSAIEQIKSMNAVRAKSSWIAGEEYVSGLIVDFTDLPDNVVRKSKSGKQHRRSVFALQLSDGTIIPGLYVDTDAVKHEVGVRGKDPDVVKFTNIVAETEYKPLGVKKGDVVPMVTSVTRIVSRDNAEYNDNKKMSYTEKVQALADAGITVSI